MNDCGFLSMVALLFSSRRHALLLSMENFWKLSLLPVVEPHAAEHGPTAWAWLQPSIIHFHPSDMIPFSIIRQACFSYLSFPFYVH